MNDRQRALLDVNLLRRSELNPQQWVRFFCEKLIEKYEYKQKKGQEGCRPVDWSMPTILPPRIRVPSTPSTLLSFIVKFVLFLKKNEIKQKEAGFGPFNKTSIILRG